MDAQPDASPTFDPRLAEALTGRDGRPGVGLDEGLAGYLGMGITHAGPGVAVVEVELRDEPSPFCRLSVRHCALRDDRTVRGCGYGRGVTSGGASR
jgi:hypothetical protein